MMNYEIEIDGYSFDLTYSITQEEFDIIMEQSKYVNLYVLAYIKLLMNSESEFERQVLNHFWEECGQYYIFVRIGVYGTR